VTDADETVVAELQRLGERIDTLQADVRRLSAPALPPVEPGWADDRVTPPSYAWVGSLDSPMQRRPAVPRLLLEILFLAACATTAAVADLDAVAVGGVMVGAWVIVALVEWASSRADRRRDELLSIPPPMPAAPAPADPSWFVPPVEQTLLDGGVGSADSATAVTRLPAPAEGQLEATAERRTSSSS
jgi:hypothetical protein